ncbi:MFS transporter [Pseudonocardiaceae bacterium YIM PH 21723]|nr:MFS transporter [Pseudonocardiaceae bacterium YIM PH 21723]
MLATGLVGIGLDFHKGPAATASLISVLYLCSAVAQPTMGKLAQVFGARRVFIAGQIVLLVAGVIGAAAPNFAILLLSRALIGIGTSAAYPTAMALVRSRAEQARTGVPSQVLANFSIAAQVTMVIGLPLGGVLAGGFGWRAIFFVNVPLAAVTLLFTLLGVARDEPLTRTSWRGLLAAVDVLGVVLFAATITLLLLFLSGLSSPDWWLLLMAGLAGAALLAWEWRATSPLVDVRMLVHNRRLVRTYLRQALVALGIYTALYGISQWMEQAAGYSAAQVGLIMLPLSLVSMIIARVVSTLGRVRLPLVLTGGFLILTGTAMGLITSSASVWVLVGISVLFGLANGFGGFANQATLYVQAPAADIAVASGLYRTFNYVGAIFSATLIGLTFGTAATDAGLHAVALVLAAIGVVFLILTTLDDKIPAVV